jgi:predicted O-linked N-acetylglucosamine transferase (SPINDLY family)
MNNFAKVTPQVLELWSRLLAALPDSQLILRCPMGDTQRRVLEVFARHAVPSSRLSLHAERFAGQEYLQLHQRMDIYLDPFPYAGHTTSLDALWMGVPLITLAGQTAAARGGVFLLANLGLPELIAHDEQDYLDRALALARDLPRLKELRSTLRQRLQQSPLMDAPRFARNIEAAYRQMWRKWCARG